MGFGRPNRSAAGDQAAQRQLQLSKIAEETAQRDKIANVSEQLDEETRLRRKKFGSRLGGGLGGGVAGSAMASAVGGSKPGGLLGVLFSGLSGIFGVPR